MKKSISIIVFFFISLVGFSQTNPIPKYNVPKEYSLVLPEDYTTYEPQIKETIDWYLWRSMGLDDDKRKNAAAFFTKWLVGSPTVTIDIDPKIVNFMNTNPQLLVPYCMGGTKYSMENNSNDRIKIATAGIEAAVTYYNKNRAFMSKDADIEKYETLIKKNKLEKYIGKNLTPRK